MLGGAVADDHADSQPLNATTFRMRFSLPDKCPPDSLTPVFIQDNEIGNQAVFEFSIVRSLTDHPVQHSDKSGDGSIDLGNDDSAFVLSALRQHVLDAVIDNGFARWKPRVDHSFVVL